MDSSTIYFTIAVALLIWLCKKLMSDKDSLESLGIAHWKPLPIIGNSWTILTQKYGFVEFGDRLYKDFSSKKIFGFYSFFGNYTLIVSDPDVAKQIMTRDFDHFVNRDKVDPNKVDKLLGKSVLMLRDEKWREMRSTLSPVYTSSKLKHMYGLLQECIDEFISAYEKKALGNNNRVVVDTHDAFARVTADGIVTTALGFKGDCTTNKESEIFKVAEDMETDFTSPRVLIFLNLFPGLCKFLGIELFRKSIHEFFETNVLGEVKRRQQLNVHRPDVIDLLIQAKNGKLDSEAGDEVEEKVIRKKTEASKWTDEDLVAQALVFFLGGFESTATLIQSIFWELAKNPDVQQTLIEEVDEVLESLNGKPISYEQLNNMKYLEMVVNETLRKWPSFRVTSRLCSKDYVVDTNDGKKYAIKKGIELFIAIGSIQMDPKYFKDPETFDPTRFDEENKKNIQSGTFIPFGIGPRMCIGSRYFLLKAKMMLFSVVAKFKVEACEGTPEKLIFSNGPSGFKGKIYVEFNVRK